MSVVSFEISSTDDGASVLTITETLSAGAESPRRGGQLAVGSVRAAAVGVHGRRRVRAVSALDDLFSALSDPTRRALFDRLLRNGPDTATRLAQHTTLTRQAVVKHLQALVDAGLAESERIGSRGPLRGDARAVGDRRGMAHRVEPRMGPARRPAGCRCRVGLRPSDVGDHMWRWTTSR